MAWLKVIGIYYQVIHKQIKCLKSPHFKGLLGGSEFYLTYLSSHDFVCE